MLVQGERGEVELGVVVGMGLGGDGVGGGGVESRSGVDQDR